MVCLPVETIGEIVGGWGGDGPPSLAFCRKVLATRKVILKVWDVSRLPSYSLLASFHWR